MTSAFDKYDKSYEQVVQDSIAFSGLKHDFFMVAKAQRLAALFKRQFGDRRPALIDIGCGIGRLHPLLVPICSTVAGCDPSADCIAQARVANPAIDYQQGDGQRLNRAERTFDVALAVCVYHHLLPAERAALTAEMRRVVRPGGLIVIIEHNPWNPLTRLAVARCPFDHDAVLLDWRESRQLLAEGGLTLAQSEHFLLLPFSNSLAARIEHGLGAWPVGAQYMTWGQVQ